jgi:hypothetical protein
MINYQNLFHTGHLVEDINAGMTEYAEGLGITWAPVHVFEELPFWTPEQGTHSLRLEVTYSCEGPQHIELLCGTAGSFYDPKLASGSHTGVWVDNVVAAAEQMLKAGWILAGAGAPAQDGYGGFCYLRPPQDGPLIELVDPGLKPAFERWWQGEVLADVFASMAE